MSRALHSRREILEWLGGVSDDALAQGMVPLFPKIEANYKKKHPQRRFVLTGDDDLMRRWYAQRDRYISILVNKGLALSTMLALLEAPTDEQIEHWKEG